MLIFKQNTLAGIKKAFKENSNFDFILKCRADFELKLENNWIDKIVDKLDNTKFSKTGVYHKKIFGKVIDNWHVDDFIFFGIKENIFNGKYTLNHLYRNGFTGNEFNTNNIELQYILDLLQFTASGIEKLVDWGIQLSKSYNQGVVLKQHLTKHHKSKTV